MPKQHTWRSICLTYRTYIAGSCLSGDGSQSQASACDVHPYAPDGPSSSASRSSASRQDSQMAAAFVPTPAAGADDGGGVSSATSSTCSSPRADHDQQLPGSPTHNLRYGYASNAQQSPGDDPESSEVSQAAAAGPAGMCASQQSTGRLCCAASRWGGCILSALTHQSAHWTRFSPLHCLRHCLAASVRTRAAGNKACAADYHLGPPPPPAPHTQHHPTRRPASSCPLPLSILCWCRLLLQAGPRAAAAGTGPVPPASSHHLAATAHPAAARATAAGAG